jgi:hypothetical protein
MTTHAHDWQCSLPAPLQFLLEGASWLADEWGCSGTQMYQIGQRFLKMAPFTETGAVTRIERQTPGAE